MPVALPVIVERPTDTEVTEGDTLHLRCAVSASVSPYSTVWWLHNAIPVIPSEFLHVTGKHLVSIEDVT